MENTILVLKTYVDGVNDTPFPQDADSPIEIGAFRYDAKRMGGAPTITASVNYPSCLDSKWTNKVYAEFRGEKYYLKQTPTSAYDNADTLYKHDIELVSERAILDNIYFFDAVVGNPLESDKAVSNSTKVVFFGSVQEFAKRLNASLEYTKLLKWEDGVNEDGEPIKIANGYNVVVDKGIGSEEKLMSFEDQFFSNVLQEIYNQYQIPYYFVDKTIHIGFSDDVYPHTFSYGVDDALISITKNNANFKIVNRVTGKGSTDNIPFYYPNNSPKGIINVEASRDELGVKIEDYQKYSDEVKIDGVVQFVGHSFDLVSVNVAEYENSVGDDYVYGQIKDRLVHSRKSGSEWFRTVINCEGETNLHFYPITSIVELYERNKNGSLKYYDATKIKTRRKIIVREGVENSNANIIWETEIYNDDEPFEIPIPKKGSYTIYVVLYWNHTYSLESPNFGSFHIKYTYTATLRADAGWYYDDKGINLNNIGLSINNDAEVNIGDTITQRLVKYVNTSQNLMPSVYRATDGKERFYNAINYPFLAEEGYELKHGEYLKNEDKDGNQTEVAYVHNNAYKDANGKYIVFKNPYFEGTPKEHVISVEDLKPTIKDTVNSMGLRMDMFSEFAYDLDDNDETEESDSESSRDFKHSYFFGKLRKLDFNLFEHAIEQQPMTISFTSGNCGACNFEIGVTEEEPQKNPVQVDENGNLIRNPETGNVVCGQFEKVTTFQDRQQDTSKYEVWIALKKEESTYGILMPKATIKEKDAEGNIIEVGGHRPKACTVNKDGTANNDGDTFVILGINLPEEYIYRAENKLRDEIIKYIKDNNEEKFNFSITFSRIFFAENPKVLEYLNENSRLNVEYNGKTYTLYVTSYSYNMGEGEALPEIKVKLDDKLTVSQNAIQNAINEVKSEVSMAFANFDVLALASPYLLRKDVDDICNSTIDFKKGIKFGEGGKVEVLDNNSAKLTIEYLEVTKKASFTSLEIKEKTHVGGQIIISPAAMTCGEVEELENAYRCYFQTKNSEGNDEIFNQFAENDLAICQTYNAWGSRYYWRKVVGVGEDYIDLSKTLCDEASNIPMAGDKIVQLGNTEDITRQAAIVLSAYGEDAPSFIMYNGINDFTLVDKNITGIIWNPKTLEPQMYSYGSFFFGDGTTDENGNLIGEDFITFQKRAGDTKKKLHINATVNFSSDSTGLSNLEEWKEVQKEITDVVKTVENVQDQIDGVVENHFYEGTPTTSNYPASEWVTNDQKINHIGDTYTDISNIESDPNSGKSWRWCRCDDMTGITDYVLATDKDGVTYKLHWHPIADTDAVKALLRVYELEKKVDDAEYLKEAFKKGSTEVAGGVVMSQMVAVRNDREKIEAFLNGSDNEDFIDNEYGKLILAAGIPEESSLKSEQLEDRVPESKTKIYENGRIETKDIHAEGGLFEKVKVLGSSRSPFTNRPFVDTINYETEDNHYNFSTTTAIDILLGKDISESGRVVTLVGTFNVRAADGGHLYDRGKLYYQAAMKTGYKAEGVATSDLSHEIVRLMAVPYSDTEVSWEVIERRPVGESTFSERRFTGQFAGLRPMTRVVTSLGSSSNRTSISRLDHTIIFDITTDGAYAYVALPSNAETGQEIEFLGLDKDLGFNITASHPIYNMYGGTTIAVGSSATYAYGSQRRHIKFFFTGSKWVMVHWNFAG